jgi:DNA-binding CsgD family transcriptional regulator
MLETLSAVREGSISTAVSSTAPSATQPSPEMGLEMGLLHAVLNQVDYGLAVVNADTRQLVYANAPALDALHPDSPHKTGLCLADGSVCTRQRAHAAQLTLALGRAKARLRGLLRLTDDGTGKAGPAGGGALGEFGGAGSGDGSRDTTVAVMPLFEPGPEEVTSPCYALLVFPKQQLCDTTTITLFARERGLTGTEGQVLALVCKGLRPSQIATSHGVQVCTVRSQLRSIRLKTASDSVRELVEKVSVLPPMARHLPQAFAALSHTSQFGGLQAA